MRSLGVAVAAAALLASGAARGEKCPNMLILLDRSGSMGQGTPTTKWEIATQAINSFVPERQSVMRFGLMVFPGFSGDACAGGSQQVACDFYNGTAISRSLSTMTPGGYTPTPAVLDQAGALPEMQDAVRRRFIILLTDGDPTCPDNNNIDANVVVTETSLRNLLRAGIKTFVIGFGQEVTPSRLDRLAEAGGAPRVGSTCASPTAPGTRIPCKYYDASDLASLNAAFDTIATIAQGELQGNSCDDSCYAIGACPTGQRCTQSVQTYDDGKYSLNLGQCVADPCYLKTCPTSQFCREGSCVPTCSVPCPEGQTCQSGVCKTDPCAADPSSCSCSQVCAKYLVCIDGFCQDDPCRYVLCPNSAPYCDRGSCYASSTLPPPNQPEEQETGKSSGCSCSESGAVLPWIVILLGSLPFLVPRRRVLRAS